jgi:hypothetical protein
MAHMAPPAEVDADAQYKFAGKTGTAQVIGIAQNESYKKENIAEEFHDHALFVAFAPVESPKIALAIIVENGGSGSSAAAPIARILFDYYLLGLQPEEQLLKIIHRWNKKHWHNGCILMFRFYSECITLWYGSGHTLQCRRSGHGCCYTAGCRMLIAIMLMFAVAQITPYTTGALVFVDLSGWCGITHRGVVHRLYRERCATLA